jgi:hypothetical protein
MLAHNDDGCHSAVVAVVVTTTESNKQAVGTTASTPGGELFRPLDSESLLDYQSRRSCQAPQKSLSSPTCCRAPPGSFRHSCAQEK